MKMADACSNMGCQAVQGVREAYQRCGASLVIMAHRVSNSQLLPSKRRRAAIDDTISGVGLGDMRCGDARAHAAQDSAHGHGRAAGLACTHVPRAVEAQERLQGRAILSRAAPLTESAQLGGAPAADDVLAVKNLRCGRGAR